LLRQAGHDVATVIEQGLESDPDPEVIAACQTEARARVTLDLDFSNPLRFNPEQYLGVLVSCLPSRPVPQDLVDAVLALIGALEREEVIGRLWIIQRGQLRIYQQE